MTRIRNVRLNAERLEVRDVPASFGVPWADPTHLTASFAPDGTQSPGAASNLNGALDLLMPRAVWQGTILRALQTWENAARINIGIVSDSGDPFGTPGATQGDPRFGDIRFGGLPMTADALGEAVPPDPVLSGTLAGDVFFNTTVTFTPTTLYKVALHEIGHALGMASSENPHSIMYDQYGAATGFVAADIRELRAMYGAPARDAAQPATGNARFPSATPIPVPPEFEGATPLFAYGAISAPNDVNTYTFSGLADDDIAGVTIRLQTAGISLATPRLSVFDATGKLLSRASMTGPEGGVTEITLPSPGAGKAYYVQVDAGGPAGLRGRYGIAVTFGSHVKTGALTVEQVLRGPYDSISAADLANLYQNPSGTLYNDDGGTDDTPGGADDLPGVYGPSFSGHFHATGSLTTASDVNYYRILAPAGAHHNGLTLVARLRAVGPNGVTPQVAVFDTNLNPVPTQVLVNGAGDYTVEVTGAAPGHRYYLKVTGSQAGNYQLDAAFRSAPVSITPFASGTAAGSAVDYKLYAARTQLFGITLSATGPAGAQVRMTISDAVSGLVVLDMTAQAGSTVSGLSTFLAPGEYNVQVTSTGSASPVEFAVAGSVVTDPLGPQPGGTALGPKYPDPNNPGGYLYPGGIASTQPYLWLLLLH
jgi:hypothetical protein